MSNWYTNFIKTASEYWIRSDGSVEFADGDSGEKNHEMIVIEHVKYEYLPNYNDSFFTDEEYTLNYIRKQYENVKKYILSKGSWDDKWDREVKSNPNEVIAEIAYIFDISDIAQMNGAPKEAILVLQNGDARHYAQKYLGWKAVRGRNVETNTLTQKDIDAIARGLGEISEQNGIDETEDPEWNIYVDSGGWYNSIPLSVIESKNISKINEYTTMRNRQFIAPINTKNVEYNPYKKIDGD